MKIKRTLYINPITGDCSDGTNMWDWSISRLKGIIDWCWDEEIANLAKEIIENQKKELLKIKL